MDTKKKYYVINGPNLNFLGIREPEIYGTKTYDEVAKEIEQYATSNGFEVEIFQSNYEGAIIDTIQECYFKKVDGIVINPGAYTHYSYAIRDAIASVSIPTIEVHLSNINEREDFRKISVIRDVVKEVFMGADCYLKALEYLNNLNK